MPHPVPLAQRRPLRDPPPLRPEETAEQRRGRQLAFLRELAELNMRAARAAADRIDDAQTEDEPAPLQADAATLSLARATRAVTTVFGVEDRIANGERVQPLRPHDPRRTLLRDALYPLTKHESNPAHRTLLRKRLDQAIEDASLDDLGDNVSLASVAMAIAKGFGLHLDLAKVSDQLLATRNRPYRPPSPFHQPPDPDPDLDEDPLDPDDPFARDPPRSI